VAVLTAVEFGRRPVKRFQSMPDGLYARLVSLDDSYNLEDAAGLIVRALADGGYAKVFVNDFYGQFNMPTSFAASDYKTTLVDISEARWQPPDKKVRSEIRKAEREGIEVLKFDAGRHFDRFWTLMKNTEERHLRRPKYPPDFFRALADLARHDDRVHWVYVESDGRAAASHIYLIENDMALNWQIYFDRDFTWLKPNQYLLYHTARMLSGRGVRTLNLGASPPTAEGLQTQKRKWGGRTYGYFCYTCQTGLGRLM
jgi:lipid II:glycine glycyltransferase (peptidoglycan interpeptide bridge formation enzyme)